MNQTATTENEQYENEKEFLCQVFQFAPYPPTLYAKWETAKHQLVATNWAKCTNGGVRVQSIVVHTYSSTKPSRVVLQWTKCAQLAVFIQHIEQWQYINHPVQCNTKAHRRTDTTTTSITATITTTLKPCFTNIRTRNGRTRAKRCMYCTQNFLIHIHAHTYTQRKNTTQ